MALFNVLLSVKSSLSDQMGTVKGHSFSAEYVFLLLGFFFPPDTGFL